MSLRKKEQEKGLKGPEKQCRARYMKTIAEKTTKCGAKQSGKLSASRAVQIMRPVGVISGCIKTDDFIAVCQQLKDQPAFSVEEALCAETTNRRFQVSNTDGQVKTEVENYAVITSVSSHDIIDVRSKGKNKSNIFQTN